jgi:hypothetical protein
MTTTPATSPRPVYTDIGKALGTDYFLLKAELTADGAMIKTCG